MLYYNDNMIKKLIVETLNNNNAIISKKDTKFNLFLGIANNHIVYGLLTIKDFKFNYQNCDINTEYELVATLNIFYTNNLNENKNKSVELVFKVTDYITDYELNEYASINREVIYTEESEYIMDSVICKLLNDEINTSSITYYDCIASTLDNVTCSYRDLIKYIESKMNNNEDNKYLEYSFDPIDDMYADNDYDKILRYDLFENRNDRSKTFLTMKMICSTFYYVYDAQNTCARLYRINIELDPSSSVTVFINPDNYDMVYGYIANIQYDKSFTINSDPVELSYKLWNIFGFENKNEPIDEEDEREYLKDRYEDRMVMRDEEILDELRSISSSLSQLTNYIRDKFDDFD